MDGSIINPRTGTPDTRQTLLLSPDDARVFREYKKLLQRLGLKEALYCQNCWSKHLSDGCDASVTDSRIVIICRCAIRTYSGA